MQIDLRKAPAKDLLRTAEAVDIDVVVSRYAREYNVSVSHAQDVARETIRYLVLFAASSKPYGIGGEIDQFWHTFILFTQRYADFCDRVAGRFIHHSPMDELSESDAAEAVSPVADYQDAFGVAPDAKIWFGADAHVACISNESVPRVGANAQAACVTKDCIPRIKTDAKAACITKECVPRSANSGQAACITKECVPRSAGAPQAACVTKDCIPRIETDAKAACITKECVPRSASAPQAACVTKDCIPRIKTDAKSRRSVDASNGARLPN